MMRRVRIAGKTYICLPCSGMSVAEAMDQHLPYPTVGHYNNLGGACCPHWGNTCGIPHWWEEEARK